MTVTRCAGRGRNVVLWLACAGLLAVLLLASAQAQDDAATAYARAAAARGGERAAALERFLASHPAAPQRNDALALLAWTYDENGNRAYALNAAQRLLAADKNAVLGLAIVAQDARHSTGEKRALSDDELRRAAERGLAAYAAFRAPAGVSALEAYRMQRRALAMLEGALGYAAFQQRDYATAQSYLRQAAQIDPGSGEDVYELALADLAVKPPNAAEAYQMLARAVKLWQGTPEAARINDFARRSYVQAGGSEQDWNGYLVAAGVKAPALTKPAVERGTQSAEGKTPALPNPAVGRGNQAKAEKPKRESEKKQAKLRIPPELGAPPDIDLAPPPRTRPRPGNGAPISLGIVIEASQAHGKRGPLVDGLSDMLGYLRQGDEAFILAFGKDLDFTQDLTASPRLLEDALGKMKPEAGAALYQAVGVAAGHLKRIAKNPNRVLLVISDGRNSGGTESAFQLESNLDEVRIYCIGVGVDSGEEQRVLQALAQRTGGSAQFVANLGQFTQASEALARTIYGGM